MSRVLKYFNAWRPTRGDILHVIEIAAIVYLGVSSLNLTREQNRLSEILSAEPNFRLEFVAEPTTMKILHIPHARIITPPSSAFTVPLEMIHRLTLTNTGTTVATEVSVKATIREGTLFRFGIIAVRSDATGAFIPEDEWKLSYLDARTHRYVRIRIEQLPQGGSTSVFFAFAYAGSERLGKEADALSVEVSAAEQRRRAKRTLGNFEIWYGL